MTFDYMESFHEGHAYNCFVADILRQFGVPDVEVPELWDAENVAQRMDKTINEKDVLVDDLVLEVKSRNLKFEDIGSFPYEKILIDTVDGLEKKAVKPFAYVIVSQITGKMFAIAGATKDYWTVGDIHDPYRNVDYQAYFVTKRHCRPFIDLVDILLERASDRASEV